MEEGPSRKLAVLLHADVVGSTALVQLNESLAHERIQGAFRRFSEIIASQGGARHDESLGVARRMASSVARAPAPGRRSLGGARRA